jgi:hypothetical protein
LFVISSHTQIMSAPDNRGVMFFPKVLFKVPGESISPYSDRIMELCRDEQNNLIRDPRVIIADSNNTPLEILGKAVKYCCIEAYEITADGEIKPLKFVNNKLKRIKRGIIRNLKTTYRDRLIMPRPLCRR